MASASSEHDAGEAPAKKPWRRPTFYVLTDVIESHGAPNIKVDQNTGQGTEDESIPPSNLTHYKKYRPTTA